MPKTATKTAAKPASKSTTAKKPAAKRQPAAKPAYVAKNTTWTPQRASVQDIINQRRENTAHRYTATHLWLTGVTVYAVLVTTALVVQFAG